MKLKYYLILVFVLVCSINLNAQNNLNRITGLSSTTASVAYSLRQLSTSYTGPLVRIKVNSLFYDVYPDATTYNFTLSSKISASISTYNAAVSAASANALSSIITAGTTNATVAIWYDQSGNAVHVLNASALATIITSGTINTMNGQPTINFTSTNSYLTSTVTVNYSSQTVATLNAAVQDVASTNYISGIISTGNNGGWGLCYDPTSTIKGYWIDASGSNGAYSKENTKDAKIVTGLISKTTDSYIYTNSQLKGNRTAQSVANGLTDNIYVGVRGNASIRKFIGNISEVFMFPKTLTAAEQTSLETSQSIFLAPFVTITSSASGAVCAGTSVTFTATTYNFSGTTTYQWYKNSVAINGETSASYITSTLANADQIYVIASAVTSNSLNANITAGPSALVTVNGDGCINKTSLTTPSGLTSYVWYKDDVIISGITTNTLTPNASGDYKVVVSNGTCSNTSSVTTIYSCGKTSEGKMSPITSSTTLVAISGKINSTYGVDERGLILNSITPVTTGLILYLDAGNLSSYSGSGTNWTDLSDRGNNGTLVGGVTYNSSNQGSLVFNGNSSGTTDSYVSLPATTDFAFGSGDFTVEMWIYANSGNNVSTFISINSSSGYAALRLENYLSNNLDAFHSSDGASHLIGKMSTSITANKWTHLVFSRINGNAKIYLDGVEKLSYALVGSLVASGNSRIGSLPGFTDRNHSGNIAITRIYKGKGLTSTEVTTQFDLLKSRFGL